MTAEFAVVLPAVVLVLGLCVASVAATGQAVRLADAAGVAARAAGRGDDALASSVVRRLAPGARLSVERGDLVCIRLDDVARFGAVPGGLALAATSCAAAQGG